MKKNMNENFEKLNERVYKCLSDTDREKIKYHLNRVKEPTLISGVGGSAVVSEFGVRVLGGKNGIIVRNMEPRDFNYMNLNGYKNVISCSYSGGNYGVEMAFLNNLKHFLLSSKESSNDDVTNLTYTDNDKERSFISLAATLIPCSILLDYYMDGLEKEKMDSIHQILDEEKAKKFENQTKCNAFEIFTGFETSTASKYLESTMIEAGIGLPIIHDKYSFCHGRSTLSTVYDNIAIYFNGGTELDKLLLNEIHKYYKDVITFDYTDSIIDEYSLLVQCMYLTKYIATSKNKDLSGVDYNPIVKRLYNYHGEL